MPRFFALCYVALCAAQDIDADDVAMLQSVPGRNMPDDVSMVQSVADGVSSPSREMPAFEDASAAQADAIVSEGVGLESVDAEGADYIPDPRISPDARAAVSDSIDAYLSHSLPDAPQASTTPRPRFYWVDVATDKTAPTQNIGAGGGAMRQFTDLISGAGAGGSSGAEGAAIESRGSGAEVDSAGLAATDSGASAALSTATSGAFGAIAKDIVSNFDVAGSSVARGGNGAKIDSASSAQALAATGAVAEAAVTAGAAHTPDHHPGSTDDRFMHSNYDFAAHTRHHGIHNYHARIRSYHHHR